MAKGRRPTSARTKGTWAVTGGDWARNSRVCGEEEKGQQGCVGGSHGAVTGGGEKGERGARPRLVQHRGGVIARDHLREGRAACSALGPRLWDRWKSRRAGGLPARL